jgi:hypothetical protein
MRNSIKNFRKMLNQRVLIVFKIQGGDEIEHNLQTENFWLSQNCREAAPDLASSAGILTPYRLQIGVG